MRTNYYANKALEGTGSYQGKGFFGFSLRIKEHAFILKTDSIQIEIEKISQDWINSLQEIIDYCEKNKIKLTLFTAPVSDFDLSARENYDVYIDFIKSLVNGKDVRYLDFNLIKEEYLPYRQTNYTDGHHMNQYGAEAFSPVLAEYINGNLPEDAFHISVAEKLQTKKPDYYGVY